jgi:parvulin-like peptidyl-prolyl isomerase
MRDSIAMLDLYGLSDYAKNVFFLTDSQINDAVEFTVMALSSQEVILNKYGEDAEFTEEELKAYYNSSSSKYNASYVKAYHILTEDKAFAEEMLKETGNTADGFMAVFEKYEKDERVTQAIDLGKFGYGQMVAEFEECAFALKEGEVGICDTEFGTHLVYVYESNITDTTYEDVKDQVLADYTADFIQYFGQSHLDEMISTYEDVAGDYDIIPADLLTEYLYNKYSVKVDKKVGSR